MAKPSNRSQPVTLPLSFLWSVVSARVAILLFEAVKRHSVLQVFKGLPIRFSIANPLNKRFSPRPAANTSSSASQNLFYPIFIVLSLCYDWRWLRVVLNLAW